jgi:hypothetical protein
MNDQTSFHTKRTVNNGLIGKKLTTNKKAVCYRQPFMMYANNFTAPVERYQQL